MVSEELRPDRDRLTGLVKFRFNLRQVVLWAPCWSTTMQCLRLDRQRAPRQSKLHTRISLKLEAGAVQINCIAYGLKD